MSGRRMNHTAVSVSVQLAQSAGENSGATSVSSPPGAGLRNHRPGRSART